VLSGELIAGDIGGRRSASVMDQGRVAIKLAGGDEAV
jgi:hypothetical protein